jgi:hypothetical protein
MAAALALSCVAVRGLCGSLPLRELVHGWAFTAVAGAAILAVNDRAVRVKAPDSPLWGLGANAVRWGITLAAVAGYGFCGAGNLQAFALTVVAGDLVFLAGSVWRLHAGE